MYFRLLHASPQSLKACRCSKPLSCIWLRPRPSRATKPEAIRERDESKPCGWVCWTSAGVALMSTGPATTRGLWSPVVISMCSCAACLGTSFPFFEDSTSSTVWRAFSPYFAPSWVSTARMWSASMRTPGPLGGQQERFATCATFTSASCDSGSVGTGRSLGGYQRLLRTPQMKACRFGSSSSRLLAASAFGP